MRIGAYEVEAELGRGSVGIVYRARDQAGNRVAVKVLAARHAVAPVAAGRLAREAQVLLRLRHPAIVRMLATGVERGAPWIASELVEGGTLERRIEERGPLPPREAAALLLDLSRAVAHAHAAGVLHRDIKPSNVLLDGSGRAFLTDFGLAKDLAGGPSLTATGQFLGTPTFWPPEQARGDRGAVGPASDVFGLGATLYAMLTGHPPVVADSLVEALAAVDRDPPPPASMRPDVPPALDALCIRCLRRVPSDRFATATDLARALEGFLHARRRPRRRGAFVGGAAVVVLAGVLAFGLTQGLAPEVPPVPSEPAPPPPLPPPPPPLMETAGPLVAEVEAVSQRLRDLSRRQDWAGMQALGDGLPPALRDHHDTVGWRALAELNLAPTQAEGTARVLALTEGVAAPQALVVRAAALASQGRADEAQRLLAPLLLEERRPEDPFSVDLFVAALGVGERAFAPEVYFSYLRPADGPPSDPTRLARGREHFERLVTLELEDEQDSYHSCAWLFLAKLCHIQGDLEAAARAQARALDAAPSDPQMHLVQAEWHLSRGEVGAARAALERARAAGAPPVGTFLAHVAAAADLVEGEQRGDLALVATGHATLTDVAQPRPHVAAWAREVALRALRVRPDLDVPVDDATHARLVAMVGRLAEANDGHALSVFELLPPTARDEPRVRLLRASAHLGRGRAVAGIDPKKAAADRARSLELVEGMNDRGALLVRAAVFVDEARGVEAVQCFKDLLHLAPDLLPRVQPDALRAALLAYPALSYPFLGPPGADPAGVEAAGFVNLLVVEGSPVLTGKLFVHSARACYAAGRSDAAEDGLSSAARLDPVGWAAPLARAEWALGRGNLDGAREALRLAQARLPQADRWLEHVAWTLAGILRTEDALRSGQKADATTSCDALIRSVSLQNDPWSRGALAHLRALRKRAEGS